MSVVIAGLSKTQPHSQVTCAKISKQPHGVGIGLRSVESRMFQFNREAPSFGTGCREVGSTGLFTPGPTPHGL